MNALPKKICQYDFPGITKIRGMMIHHADHGDWKELVISTPAGPQDPFFAFHFHGDSMVTPW